MEFAGSLPSSQHAGDEVLDAHSQTTDPPPPPPSAPSQRQTTKIFDDATVIAGYDTVPLIQIDTLPRGGISFETKAVGRIQVGSLHIVHPKSTFSMHSVLSDFILLICLLFFSLEYLQKLSKTAWYLAWKFQLFMLFQLKDFAGNLGMHLA
jgi:hypothetical protein